MKECCSDGEECGSGCGKMAIIAALLLALGMIGGGYMLSKGDYAPTVYANNANTPQEHVISTSGTVTEQATPDLLVIRLSIITNEVTAGDSQQQNAEVVDELLTELKNLGVPDDQIQTTGYDVDEVYDSYYDCDEYEEHCRWTSELIGYDTTHEITVSLEQLDLGGAVIDAAASAGTNETFVDSVYYTLKDETREEMTKELLQKAAVEAKAKAQKIADGLGVSLGDVTYAGEDHYSTPYYYERSLYSLESIAYDYATTSTSLSPGEVELSATVSLTYEISN
jgi:uncharacterized protein YggE